MGRRSKKQQADAVQAAAILEPAITRPAPIPDDLADKFEAVGLTTADKLPEVAVAEALLESQKPTHVERLSQPRGLRPTPTGFQGMEGHYEAGIRLSRSLDKNVIAIQFSDDKRPSRDGLNPENQRLRDRGFLYVPMRSQWERVDRERPAENYQDAKTLVAALVEERLSGPVAQVQR